MLSTCIHASYRSTHVALDPQKAEKKNTYLLEIGWEEKGEEGVYCGMSILCSTGPNIEPCE